MSADGVLHRVSVCGTFPVPSTLHAHTKRKPAQRGLFHSRMTQTRIRGRLHQQIRRAHLAANPLCVHCAAKGVTRQATEVDHVVALSQGGEESRDPNRNRQALCAECHRIKTQRDLNRRRVGLDGWPL